VSGFDHFFQIADAAFVAVFVLFGSFVFKIFTQVAERACALDLLDQLGHQLQLAVVQLLLHHFNVLCGQIVMHSFSFPFMLPCSCLRLYAV
jgi:hypothetical protein